MDRKLLLAGSVAGVALVTCSPLMAQQTATPPAAPAAPAAPSPPLSYGMPISLALAKRAAAAAEAEAKKAGFPSAIIIVGPNGETIYAEKMDGSNNSAVMAAEQKAKGAALYRRPSKFFEDRVQQAPYVIQLAGISVIGGGIPLVSAGHIVGAIGVSGAPNSTLDAQAAQAGVDAVK